MATDQQDAISQTRTPEYGHTASRTNSISITASDVSQRMQQIQQLTDEIGAQLEYLRRHTEVCAPDRKVSVQALREALVAWRMLIEPSADALDQWLVSQHERINSDTSVLSAEFVDVMLNRYEEVKRQIMAARSELNQRAAAADEVLEKLNVQQQRQLQKCKTPN
jgi:hypothetical protein